MEGSGIIVLPCRGAKISCLQIDRTSGGTAPQLVFVHGLATNMAFWYAGIAAAFAGRARIMILDLRGHGRSSTPQDGYKAADLADDLGDVLDILELDDVHLIGHSYGALVSAAFATAQPDRVKTLTLADMRLPSVQRQLSLSESPIGQSVEKQIEKFGLRVDRQDPDFGLQLLTELARLKLNGDERAERLEKVFISAGRFMGPRAAKKWLRLLETTTAQRDFQFGSDLKVDDFRSLSMPLYVPYGENSMTLPSGFAISEAMPSARFEVIQKAGHFFPSSRPFDFVKRVSSFLKEEGRLAA